MVDTFDNAAWAQAAPVISILIPFLRDDPSRLLTALEHQARHLENKVELAVLDDGTGDEDLAARVRALIAGFATPTRFLRSKENLGRAKGRNQLAAQARGAWLLFLDSDMLPDADSFLSAYLALIAEQAPAVAFGGFSLDQAPHRPDHALHRTMALRSDCAPSSTRRLAPEKHVFTSNLLVRSDVFDADRFDESFVGWGWEDVEWAMRVSRRHPILHLDNTATHLGLDPASTIAAKYEQSAANFARVAASHPDILARYPSYRAARVLKRAPLRRAWRPMLKGLALSEIAPLGLRAFSMRLYRAALYAEAI